MRRLKLRFAVYARHLACSALALGVSVAPASFGAAATTADATPADKLLVVDCLLPGQVRRLGQQITYLSARRAVKTAAGDCEIRGGEYVAYDRADYATALNAWLPSAKEGDPAAQTYVGEIYEKGLGIAPDHRLAAEWYRKAAAQGYARAQINLGFLTEKGLGVEKDPKQALEWYRKAAGLEGAIALDGGVEIAGKNAEIEALRHDLDSTRRDLDQARRELEKQKQRTQSEIHSLKRKQEQAARAGNTAAASQLMSTLTQRTAELANQQQRVTQLESDTHVFLAQIALLQQERGDLKKELSNLQQSVARAAEQLTQRQQQSRADQAQADSLRHEVTQLQQRVAASVDRRQLTALEAELQAREAGLRAKETSLAASRAEIARLEENAKQQKALIAKMEILQSEPLQRAVAPPESAPVVAYAPPSIQLIEPPVMTVRGPATVAVRTGVRSRDIVGRVTAPAGLLSLTVNDRKLTPDKQGLFRSQVELQPDATPVRIVAVDTQGKRAALDFSLVTEVISNPVAKVTPPHLPRAEFGVYHALVIGNEKYNKLPSLDTAALDAKAVGDLLTQRYGFKVTLLTNATRYQTLSELNKLRAQLTEKDNLLIYYAGHGELDRTNLRGHWLPVDAEPNSDANWISSVAITDILNAMSAKHVLVVADSCYSGAMTRSSIGRLEAGMSEDTRLTWLRALAKARSRTVLTSGGLQPVIDGGGGRHSIFAKQFLEVLTTNEDPLEGQRLYHEVSARVLAAAVRLKQEQKPEYAPLKFAGHESGDFLFVPVN